ncbi:hypothetical protein METBISCDRAFT_25576 [Metschnikowia bicuspidata]|uniref:Mating factor alpha precursor N-terminal domain-containing protein n=1 Tax=Metschnikowia bicuspidata TaxID=27322 RepID=A0A4P9ZHK2_9ASCO|nr:hypothetical protein METBISCDRAFT_25576 [Metschnikowia bicuspidata]
MKFSYTAIFAVFAAIAHAAPIEGTSSDEVVAQDRMRIPSEAIIGMVDYTDITPVVLQKDDGQNELVFLNNTIMEQASAENVKRDADAWHWVYLRPGAPIWKREAEADADAWHWVFLRPGAPIWKREANTEAEASA